GAGAAAGELPSPGVHAVTIVDGRLEWQEHPDPEPGTGELLVAVRAAGINGADILQRGGHYPAPPGSPADIPGLEMAGEVVAVGPGARRFSPGSRVMAVVGGGGHGELVVVHERAAMPVPDGVPWEQAGGFPEAFTTAHDALFSQCALAMGERLLVNGAAGGVGTAGVQLGAAAGATVVGTCRRSDQRDAVAALGQGVTVVAPDQAGGDGPYDVVLELVGGPNLAADVDALATNGRVAIIGVGAGHRAEVDLRTLMQRRGRILASTLRARPLEGKAAAARAVEAHVLPLLASGRIRVPVDATFPMAEATTAYDRFTAGGKVGKIVLTAGP
ncbi:MAG: zinc-binding dehydrogenase, partial [Acidimicrobiales bacterium]